MISTQVKLSPSARIGHHVLDLVRGEGRGSVLPVAKNQPSLGPQELAGLRISAPIGSYLVGPVLRVGLRDRVMLRAAVPETSVYKHGDSKPRKDHVCSASQCGDRSAIHMEPKPSSVQQSPEFNLGFGVAPAVRSHAASHAFGRSPRVSLIDHMFDFPGVSPSTFTESCLA